MSRTRSDAAESTARALRAALIVLGLWLTRRFLPAVALGGLTALLLHPFAAWLARRLGRRGGLAPAITTLIVVLILLGPLTWIGFAIVDAVQDFVSQDLAAVVRRAQAFSAEVLGPALSRFGVRRLPPAGESIQRIGAAIAGYLGAAAGSVPGVVIDVFLLGSALYYFLRDGERFVARLAALAPFGRGDTERLFRAIDDTIHGAILAMIVTSLVQGGLTTVALAVFGVPRALLLGAIATVLALIPVVGTGPVTIGATVYLALSGRFGAAIGMGIAAIVVGISDNVVRPFTQASRARTHPLLVLLGIFGGVEVLGLYGVFLGPIVVAAAVFAATLGAPERTPPRTPPPRTPPRPPPAGREDPPRS